LASYDSLDIVQFITYSYPTYQLYQAPPQEKQNNIYTHKTSIHLASN